MIRASVRCLTLAALLAATPASAFHDDEERAKAEAAYRAAVLANGAAIAASAEAEAARIEELKPRLTESQRDELERCQANGMIYVSPTVGCRLFWEDR
jgi:hypothetical protein